LLRQVAGRAKSSLIEPQIALHLDYLEGELGESEWFAGDALSAADVQMRAFRSTPRRPAAGCLRAAPG
jgi:glutathione S-transferase